MKELPVILFEHFQNFTIEFKALGRSVKLNSTRAKKYRRIDVYKYKPTTELMKITENADSDDDLSQNSKSSESQSKDGLGAINEENEEDDEHSFESGVEADDDSHSIIVGDLNVKQIRVSYVIIPGDSVSQGASKDLERYFSKHRKILVALCGAPKPGIDVKGSTRWMKAAYSMSSFEKTAALQKSMEDIKLEALNKTLLGNYSSENFLRQKHMARLLRTASKEVFENIPANESIFCSKTENGEILPPNTIAYTYLDYYQFLSATVARVDVTLPMTYALVNLPNERSVPKLRV